MALASTLNLTQQQIATKPGVALLVAASDATTKVKGLADYVCDGTADDVEIAAALAALPNGGTVYLSEGTFNLAASITYPAQPLKLVGCGQAALDNSTVPPATVMNFTLAAPGNCIVFSNDDQPQTFEGCGLNGDGANTGYGVYIQGSASFKVVRGAIVTAMTSAGVRGDNGNSQNICDRVISRDISMGFSMYGTANRYLYCQAMRSVGAGVGGVAGYQINETGSTYCGCLAERYDLGFNFSNYCIDVTLVACFGDLNNVHIRIDGNTAAPQGSTILSFVGMDASHGANSAVYLDDAVGTTLVGVTIKNSTSNKALEVTANTDTVTILGGWTDDTTVLTDGGATRLRIRDFYNYVAQNGGAAAGVADGGNIAHGLSMTPSHALVTGSVATEIVSVTGLGAANITVAIKTPAGAAGTPQTIYWRAWR